MALLYTKNRDEDLVNMIAAEVSHRESTSAGCPQAECLVALALL